MSLEVHLRKAIFTALRIAHNPRWPASTTISANKQTTLSGLTVCAIISSEEIMPQLQPAPWPQE